MIFSPVVEWRFCRGICDIHRFSGWFFVVSLWCQVGEIVVRVYTISGCENFPRFADLFLGG
jgi:hypothetical protein